MVAAFVTWSCTAWESKAPVGKPGIADSTIRPSSASQRNFLVIEFLGLIANLLLFSVSVPNLPFRMGTDSTSLTAEASRKSRRSGDKPSHPS
jgi:hypothetical protein